MNIASSKPRMNVPEFFAWAEQQPRGPFELVDGEIIAMSLERARHDLAKFEAALAFRKAIPAAQLACTVFTDGTTIVIDENTSREPDAVVQCGIEVDLNSTTPKEPLIVLEVVSPSSERDEKHRLGRTARIIASAARSSPTDAMMNAAVRIFAPVVFGEEDR